MKTILVTGSTGQLGSELKDLQERNSEFIWIFADRNKVSLNNLELLEKQIIEINPDIIINCAAYTAVDKAEEDYELANTINHLSIGVISEYTSKNNVKLIHISTDYVFDGNSSVPLNENSKTNPINVYGSTKLNGEIVCIKNNPNSIIIRTSWVYSRYGNNFVKVMQKLMSERDVLNIVNDQIGSPTYAADLAESIMIIINSKKWIPGIYNYSNEGEISWFDFAKDIKELKGYKCELNGIPSLDYPTPASRPNYSLLDKTKIKNTYGIKIPFYIESLKKCIR